MASDPQGRRSPHQGKTKGPELQRSDGKVHEALGHIVGSIFRTYQPSAKKGEPGLHEKHQECAEHPDEVGALVQIDLIRCDVLGKGHVVASQDPRAATKAAKMMVKTLRDMKLPPFGIRLN